MGSYRVQLLQPLAIVVVFSVTVSEISAQTRGKHKEHYRNYTEAFLLQVKDPKFLLTETTRSTTCMANNGIVGTCLASKACRKQGGLPMGTCDILFGTCCIVENVCDGSENPKTVTLNGTHLRNSATFFDICGYEIPRQPGVCQIKLDFNQFRIQRPETNSAGNNAQQVGNCLLDTFTMSGYTNAVIGPLCGDLTGQHMYLDYGSNDKINLDFFLMQVQGQGASLQQWDITVTMIRCDSTEKAPPGCFQYLTAQSDVVRSFNYNNQQLNNQDYSVCIRTNIGMRRITWRVCAATGESSDFVITDLPAAPVLGGIVIGQPVPSVANPTMCLADWVMVFGDNKYCGSGFAETSTTTQPFMLQVRFNAFEITSNLPGQIPAGSGLADAQNIGFCLRYIQSSVTGINQ